MTTIFESTRECAATLDRDDELSNFRSLFHLPKTKSGEEQIYLCGNSLGLQPKQTKEAIIQELNDWKKFGVEGHFHAKNPWMPYHEFLTNSMAKLVGAKPIETVVMNSLTVNLHLLLVSFYRPSSSRNKIIIESDAFPSDKYAVESQIKYHGFNPKDSLIELAARKGETCLREEDIEEAIKKAGDDLALVMLGNTNYYTGQFFNMKRISTWAHQVGAYVGFDCAHGAGNVLLNLHDSACDFAVWCSYKYLNSGPGSLAGAFVHERHAHDFDIPRFEGWWGHKKETRFKMRDAFEPIPGIEAWQLSNPPILSMAAVWSSLRIFEEAGIERLREKSILMTSYLEFLVKELGDQKVRIITPTNPKERGAQLSIQVLNAEKGLFNRLSKKGVVADWREPDVIRVAPVPLYNSFVDVFEFYLRLKSCIEHG
ncbi:MAG: kynureninase [Bacteroidota bacterium]